MSGQTTDEAVVEIEALCEDSFLSADEVLSYLHDHPEFFSAYADDLARMPLPTRKEGNVISMANWQSSMLRSQIDENQAYLEQLIVQAANNQRHHDKIFQLVAHWLAQVDSQPMPEVIETQLQQTFDLDAVHIMLWDESSRRALHPADTAFPENVMVFANSLRAPYCGPCKGFEIEQVLAQKSSTGLIASLAIVPLWGKRTKRNECIGVLLLGDQSAQRFKPDMGTMILQRIGDMAGAALSRIRVES